jgi:3-keto-disaccharide hydrolase
MNVWAFGAGSRFDSRLALLVTVALVCVVGSLSGCGGAGSPAQESWITTFDDGAGWNLSSDAVADVSIVDGALQVHIFSPGQLAWTSSQSDWQDCHVEVSATQVSGPVDNEYGILMRMDDDESFYAFSVSGDGYVRAAQYDDGLWSLLSPDWTPSDAVNEGTATNRLEVIAVGPDFEFRVNDQIVLEVQVPDGKGGPIGLYAGAFSEGDVVIAFDDLNVTQAP